MMKSLKIQGICVCPCMFMRGMKINYLKKELILKKLKMKKINFVILSIQIMSLLGINFLKNYPYIKKLKFLKNYKFTIAFENSVTPGYNTEKLIHPIIANSIPIYFGDPFVSRDFNTKSFINVHDFKNMDDVIKRIIQIDNDDKLYERILNEPWLKDNKKNKYMDKKKLKKRIKEIFG